MANGKTLKLFMPNNKPEELIIASVDNWTGKGIRIPRNNIKSSTRPELNQHGVYFLFCGDNNGIEDVYIGEAGQDTIGNRLTNHINDYNSGKEAFYWHTAVFYVDNGLDKAKTLYIEDELVKAAKQSSHYNILTKKTSSNALHDESDISAMDTFIEYIKLTIGPLGYSRILSDNDLNSNSQSINTSVNNNSSNNIFYCNSSGANASGYISNGGFTVVKGSKVGSIKPSFNTQPPYKVRIALENAKVIDNGVLTKDYEFTSPSQASSVVTGRASNGKTDWKLSDGTMFKDVK